MQLSKRIEENRITEQQYRELSQYLNYSALRTYLSSRHRFIKEYVLNEPREDEESASTLIGHLCHSLLSGIEGEFERCYAIATVKEPTGQVMELVMSLYNHYIKNPDSDIEDLFLEAVNSVKYDRDLKEVAFKGKDITKILAMFTERDKNGCCPAEYYKELCANKDKTAVTISQVQAAEKVVEGLKSHEFTRDIVNQKSEGSLEVFNELPVLWKWKDVPCKSLIDKLIVDHSAKKVIPIDWKISWEVESFERSYIKNKYWLQVGMYSLALAHWMAEHDLDGYELEPISYVVADPTGNSSPLVYKLTAEDTEMAIKGFNIRGYHYPGTQEVLEMIEWHVENGIWVHSKEAAENKGIMPLQVMYDK